MEGTSGIANPTLLRGSGGGAALGPGGVRASDVFAPCGSAYAAPGLPGARRTRERAAGEPARAGRRGSTSSYPSRGWGSCGGIVTGVCPSRALPSRALPQRESRSATPGLQPAAQRSHDRGVRADRAGINPLSRAPAKGPATEGGTGGESRRSLLTRETSAGGVFIVGAELRLRAARRDGAARIAREDFGPGAARRGSGGRAVVLTDGCGCRSRRAALGPGPKKPRV